IEYLLFAAHRVFCWFADQLLPLASVELDYKKPDYADEYRRLFVGAPISYDRERCSLAFRQSVLSLPNVRDFNALKRFLRELPLALYATNYVNQDIAGQLNNWLAAHTRRNQKLPGVDEASNYLGLHPQGMRRALAKSGNSFAAIRAQVLREAAKAALLKGEKSVEQIAYDLGFSERGAFIRAFKRWTGLTPLAWKKQLAMQP
ncbi:MAG: AraC family transcriptional regulator, partial [Pseudomonadales bacterium]